MYLGNGLETSCEIQRCLESYSCDADAFKVLARRHKRPSVPQGDLGKVRLRLGTGVRVELEGIRAVSIANHFCTSASPDTSLVPSEASVWHCPNCGTTMIVLERFTAAELNSDCTGRPERVGCLARNWTRLCRFPSPRITPTSGPRMLPLPGEFPQAQIES